MSYETKKAEKRRKKSYLFAERVFVGRGIDIGCGKDVLSARAFKKITSVEPFDRSDGDAQSITLYKPEESYDFVYSSNCLEHMEDPEAALRSWFALVRDGGYLVFTVPDEDLYEQGVFPSRFNPDHKWTFTVHKRKSWSPRSINIIDLLMRLDGCKIIKIEIIDTNYNYQIKNEDQTRRRAEAFIEVVVQKKKTEEYYKG